jgi:hypothetical protein
MSDEARERAGFETAVSQTLRFGAGLCKKLHGECSAGGRTAGRRGRWHGYWPRRARRSGADCLSRDRRSSTDADHLLIALDARTVELAVFWQLAVCAPKMRGKDLGGAVGRCHAPRHHTGKGQPLDSV